MGRAIGEMVVMAVLMFVAVVGCFLASAHGHQGGRRLLVGEKETNYIIPTSHTFSDRTPNEERGRDNSESNLVFCNVDKECTVSESNACYCCMLPVLPVGRLCYQTLDECAKNCCSPVCHAPVLLTQPALPSEVQAPQSSSLIGNEVAAPIS